MIDWLLENGGPAIKLLIHRDIIDISGNYNIEELAEHVLRHPKISPLLGYMDVFKDHEKMSQRELFSWIHNRQEDKFENYIKTIVHTGLFHGISALDDKVELLKPVYTRLMDEHKFYATVLISNLLRINYMNETMVKHVTFRIKQLHRITDNPTFDYFMNREDLSIFPKWMENNKVLSAEYSPYLDNRPIPLNIDMELISNLKAQYLNDEAKSKYGHIVNYVVQNGYQNLKGDLGWIQSERTYHAANNSFVMPFYDSDMIYQDNQNTTLNHSLFLNQILIMSKNISFINTESFQRSMAFIEECKMPSGRYFLPLDLLFHINKQKSLYYDLYIGERVKEKLKRTEYLTFISELYSTYYVNLIKKNIEHTKKI